MTVVTFFVFLNCYNTIIVKRKDTEIASYNSTVKRYTKKYKLIQQIKQN